MSDFERDRAEAQAVYDRMMMETHWIVMQARAPRPPVPKPPSLWRRLLLRLYRAYAHFSGTYRG